MKKLILFLLVGMFLISLVSAELGAFPQSEDIILKGNLNATSVTITVSYPNSTIAVDNLSMTQSSGNFWTYTFNHTDTLGEYNYIYCNQDGQSCKENTFKVTPNGQDFNSGQSLGGLGLLIGVLAISFAFLFIGIKLSENDKTTPIGFFFSVMAIILLIYGLHLGWIFSQDILQYQTLSEGVQTIFVVVLWSSVGIAIIFFVLMFFAFVKELGKMNKKKKFGEDFNPITDTYE